MLDIRGADREAEAVIHLSEGTETATSADHVERHPYRMTMVLERHSDQWLLRQEISVWPQRTTLYSSAQARPSSVAVQCSSGMPPPLEKNSS